MKRDKWIPDDFKSWNELMVRKYDPEQFYSQSGFAIRCIEARRVQAVVKLTAAKSGDRILEVGCGAGNILDNIERGDLMGLDISESMVAKSKARLGERAQIVLADAQEMPFAQASFDKVICSEVLEHLPDPGLVLAEIARILKPHGFVIVSVPNEPLINFLKDALRRLRLYGLVSGRLGGYRSPVCMDEEWHLHTFDLRLLLDISRPLFQPVRILRIPSRLLPIRYAVRFKANK